MHDALEVQPAPRLAARRLSPLRGAATEGWSLSRILEILRRRARFVAAVTAALLAAALIYLMLAPNRYTATATIIPDTKRTPPAPTEVDRTAVVDPAVVEDQIETLRSEKVALAVIDRLALWRDPEFVAPGLLDRVLAQVGIGQAAPVQDEALARRVALGRFLHATTVTRVGRSDAALIAFTAKDPDKAARIANAITDAYVQDQLGLRFFNAERTSQWAQQRLAELAGKVQAATQAVETYRRTSGIALAADGKTAEQQELDRQAAQVDSARADLAAARARATKVQSVLAQASDGETMPDRAALQALDSPAITSLLRDAPSSTTGAEENSNGAGESNLHQQLVAELQRLSTDAQSDVETAEQRLAQLGRAVGDLRARTATDAPKVERLRALEANQHRLKELRDLLQTRYARVSDFVQQQSLPVTEARVLADATPPLSRSSPKILLVLALALLAGLVAGALAALARERLDRTVTRPDQLEGDMNLRCLGVLPCVTGRKLRGRGAALVPLASDRWMPDLVGETLRGVKLAVDDAVATPDGCVVAVTSAEPGVGKSTVALSLAMTAARAGFHTLLVDADTRHPSLAQALLPGAEPSRPASGGKPEPEQGIATLPLGFDLLGHAALRSQHSTDVLASRGIQSLVRRLRGGYDYIVIDTAAMSTRIDAAAAAGLFDAVILVAEYGRTRLDALGRAIATSSRLGELVIGAVINKGSPAVRVTS